MARRRQAQGPPAFRLILDSGAVIALSRRDDRARAALAAAWEVGADVSIPAVVVAETTRGSGPRDAPVNRVIAAVGDVGVTDEVTGRAAGALLGAAGSDATIDALVVAHAIERGGGVILTGDPDDLRRLAEGHAEVAIKVCRRFTVQLDRQPGSERTPATPRSRRGRSGGGAPTDEGDPALVDEPADVAVVDAEALGDGGP